MSQRYAVNIVAKVSGGNKVKKLNSELKDLTATSDKIKGGLGNAATAILSLGTSAKGAVAGVRALGAAITTSLGPISAALATLGGLTAGFQTLQQQDFAEAKFRSLGGSSDELVESLKKVSAELKGQASVVELTGAAYDVASAGFTSAAEASEVLKAASLGATGGFSDINTVANAATSVLNAYGLAASEAGILVDQFIQTQNDGKIVVAEYASNIGKVASAAAGLKVPLSEVNAIIAQSTASGVQAEVAFTGLKGAIAVLASGQANKKLADLGLNINAGTIAADGFIGTLRKIKESGADVGKVFEILGTEASPALLPVLENLEKTEKLLKNQENAAGAAAKAQAQAADTIQNAIKAVQTEFQNFFSDQSELGEVIKVSLQAAALLLKGLAAGFNFLLAPVTALIRLFKEVGETVESSFQFTEKVEAAGQAVGRLTEIFLNLVSTIGSILRGFGEELLVAFQGPIDAVVGAWETATGAVQDLGDLTVTALGQQWEFYKGVATTVFDAVGSAWTSLLTNASGEATAFGNFVNGVWNAISSGVQSVIGAITGAFSTAFNQAKKLVDDFYNSLPAWLRGALDAAVSVVGAVTSAVSNSVNQGGQAIRDAFQSAGGAQSNLTAPNPRTQTTTSAPGPTGGGAGSAGGRAGGGASAAPKTDDLRQLQGEIDLREKLLVLEKEQYQAELQGDELLKRKIQLQIDLAKLENKTANKLASLNTEQGKQLQTQIAQLEKTKLQAEARRDLAKIYDDEVERVEATLRPLEEQRRILEATLVGRGEEERLLIEIERITRDLPEAERGRAEALVRGNAALREQLAEVQKLDDLYAQIGQRVASGLVDGITAAIDGSKDLQEVLSDILKDIGKMLLQFGVNSLFSQIGLPGFADGGVVQPGQAAIVGERGPELLLNGSSPTTVVSNEDAFGAARAAISSPSGTTTDPFTENAASLSATNSFTRELMRERDSERIMGSGGSMTIETQVINNVEYATVDQVKAASAASANKARAQVFADMRNKPSTRRQLGIS